MRDRIQRIALDNRRYGYRRVGAELRRQGFVVNHKRCCGCCARITCWR